MHSQSHVKNQAKLQGSSERQAVARVSSVQVPGTEGTLTWAWGSKGKRPLCGWGIAVVARLCTPCPRPGGFLLWTFSLGGAGSAPAHTPSPGGQELDRPLAVPDQKEGFPSEHLSSPHNRILLCVSWSILVTHWEVSGRGTEPCSPRVPGPFQGLALHK